MHGFIHFQPLALLSARCSTLVIAPPLDDDVPDELTNSTPRTTGFSSPFSFARASLDFRRLSRNAHDGNPPGSYKSDGSVVSYCAAPDRSTNANNLSASEGLRRAVDSSSLLLKWVPLRLRSRNC